MSLSDLHPIAELRRREAHYFDSATVLPNAKRILLYSVDPWQLGLVEQFLHLAFQLRGHLPTSIYYDGLLPVCGWENHWVKAPPVETLKRRAEFIFESLQIPAIGISSFLDRATAQGRAEVIVDSLSCGEWKGLVYRKIRVGQIAIRDLTQYSMGYFEVLNDADEADYRRHMIHAIMSVDLAYAIIHRQKPDIVVLVNGKLVMYSYMYEVARHLGVEVTTWEEGMYSDRAIRLAHNARAIDFSFEPEVWAAYQRLPRNPIAIRKVEDYFARWRGQSATFYTYYAGEIRDVERIRRELGLAADGRIISIFTNIVWDSNALDKDDAFESMMDWVFTTIDYTAAAPGTTLIIRAHPGEFKCAFRTRTTVRAMIVNRYGYIPHHLRMVDGESELSSYEIARMSDRCAVYTSTLGVEFILMGLQPLICGVPYYSRQGFTNDVIRKSHYARLVSGVDVPRASKAELLKRFMYLVIFKLLKHPEFIVGMHATPQQPRIHLDTFEGFPTSMPEFNTIVNRILDRKSFINLTDEQVPSMDLPTQRIAIATNCRQTPAGIGG